MTVRANRLDLPVADSGQLLACEMIRTLIQSAAQSQSDLGEEGDAGGRSSLEADESRALSAGALEECVLWRAAHTNNLACRSERCIGRIA